MCVRGKGGGVACVSVLVCMGHFENPMFPEGGTFINVILGVSIRPY